MADQSLWLRVDWIKKGEDTMPTLLVFTGFGHRLDPWQRLRLSAWRIGVIRFPIGSPPTLVWTPEAMLQQLNRYWLKASRRALIGFSFGAAGVITIGRTLLEANEAANRQGKELLAIPEFSACIAPVQWAKAPWTILKTIPPNLRLKALKGIGKGSQTIVPFLGKVGGASVKQFTQVIERYVGWEFVAHYLPYLDWIDTKKNTVETLNSFPWETAFFAATHDQVIPLEGMQKARQNGNDFNFHEVDGQHFNAVDRSAELLYKYLA